MGSINQPTAVALLVAAFSADPEALTWTQKKLEERFGPVAHRSQPFDFVETDYYEASMGKGLQKPFFVMQNLIDPGALAEIKRLTNRWEEEYATLSESKTSSGSQIERPLNLDPGYLTLAKLVLASTKDHAHRIYLAEGIYAEITLTYRKKKWQSHPWTFPDYQRSEYQDFFSTCRNWLREQ